MKTIEELQKIINESKSLVFFGGAGVSTESGIADFRSQNGLYQQKWKYPPETIISHSFFENNPEEFFRFYKEKMIILNAQPNPAHLKLAELERNGQLAAVVTQNIDGLHHLAGNHKIYELHGSIHRNYCTKCGAFYDASYILSSQGVPRCQKNGCQGLIKPDVVLYEEGLDNNILNGAIQAIEKADTLIIGGTSLIVYPAASLIQYFHGRHLVLINKSTTQYDNQADLVFHEKIGEIFAKIKVN